MNILLIAPPIMDHIHGQLTPIGMDAHRECPPYGIYLLAGALRQAGHTVALADLIALGTNTIDSCRTDIEHADLIGIGCTSMSWATARDLIDQIRKVREKTPIVLGGIHPTMFDEYLLRSCKVDYVVRGEGELSLVALATALEQDLSLSGVPNLSWLHEGELKRNAVLRKMAPADMAHIPVPDYSEMPSNIYYGLSIESSRGCAFDCSFCSTSYRTTWRALPPDVFVNRLEQVLPFVTRTRSGTIHIIDDEFSMNPRRAVEIARTIRSRALDVRLIYDSRANDLLFPEYVESMAPLTHQFLVGAECGYDDGLKKIGKGTTCSKLEEAARILRANGLAEKADFSFVIGLPWERRDEVEKTIDFATLLHADYGVRILLQWYCEIPGSRLWQADFDNGLVTAAMYDKYGFFSDLYLFRVGVKLEIEDIYELSEKIAAVKKIANTLSGRNMIEHSFPAPIARNYPSSALRRNTRSGLVNLREVAQPQVFQRKQETEVPVSNLSDLRVGIPLRHFNEL
jgi:anaerobic magnesium-protoporphyrin IX monomethyl ester cyclase